MVNIKFMLSLLTIFIATIMLVVFLQYSSNSNINNLIAGNQELLSEFVMKSKIQNLLEDLTTISTEVRKMINKNVRQERGVIDDHIKTVGEEIAYLKKIAIHDDTKKKLNELDVAVHSMIQCYNIELDTFYKDVHAKPEVLLAYGKTDTLATRVLALSNYLSTSKDEHLINLIQQADQNAKEAKKWGLTLAILAIFASMYAFWYINKKVTVQASLIRQLNESEKKVKEAATIKENFMANMSHEIRTPMNAILGFINLLQKQAHDLKSREFIESIQIASESLLTIINDILDFSKIEAGMMRIEAGQFSLPALLHSVQTMFIEKAKEKGIHFTVQTAEDIPPLLVGDAVRLTQILVNLIGNAIKFTAAGSIEVTTSNHKQEGDIIYLSFSIKDTGIGIPATKIKQVFERFNQADEDTTRKYGGTGLGLAIVKQLVELQNGTITVNSKEGYGSEFIFIVPYKMIQQEIAEPALPKEERTFVRDKKISVLVVEDNVMNQNLMKHLLSGWNMQFIVAQNGLEAIEQLKMYQFDVILMDIQMPQMNGYMATQVIRDELKLDVPIIALTAHAMAGEKEKCLGYGMNEYISKPVKEKELFKIIEALVNQQATAYQGEPGATHEGFKVIDLHYLHELSAGNKSFEKNMTAQFIAQLPDELRLLEAAFNRNAYDACRQIVHNMKTSLSFLGLTEKLQESLNYLEDHISHEKDSHEIRKHFIFLKTTCQEALREAEVYLSNFI